MRQASGGHSVRGALATLIECPKFDRGWSAVKEATIPGMNYWLTT